MDDARDIAVGDQADRGAGLAHFRDQVGVARTIEDAGGDFARGHALGLCERVDVVAWIGIKVDDAFGITAADCDLVHVGVGGVEQAATFGDCDDGERVCHRFGGQRGAFKRVERDVDLWAPAGADLLANEKHRRFIAFAFADDDSAFEVAEVQRGAHRVYGGLVGVMFVAAADLFVSRDRGRFGDAR